MQPQQKICARCGQAFACQAYNIQACQCSSVVLTTAQLQYIKQHWADCICLTCLLQISEMNLPLTPTS